jgi:hypothetical protein
MDLTIGVVMMNSLNKKGRSGGPPEQTINSPQPGLTSRRIFLKQAIAIGAVGLIGPGLLAACSDNQAAERVGTGNGSTNPTSPEGAAASICEGAAELSTGDVAARQAVGYVDASPHADKVCANCQFFKQPAAGAACGGCQVVKGPIAPEGYCNAWVAQG